MVSAQQAPAPPSAPRRGWLGLAIVVVALVVLASALVLLVHGARSEAGTRWLLQRVPGLSVSDVQGSLIGDALRIGSLQWQGDATQPSVRIDGLHLEQPQWRLLPFAGGWVSLSASALSAQRVVVRSPRESTPTSGVAPPLRLPIAVSIDAVTIAELQLDDAAAWRDVRAAVRLGANDGDEHRVEGLSLHNDRLRIGADGHIGSDAPSLLSLQLQASPLSGTPWQAHVAAAGPLANFALNAKLRSDERDPNAPQVDVQARVEPFAAWPLAALQLSTRALDLAALSSAAPRTRIDAQATIQSVGLDRPAQASLQLQNHEPGRWDAGRVPVRQAQLELGGTPSRLDRVEIRQFDALLGDERLAGGRVQGRGQWVGSELQLQLQLSDVDSARLVGGAPPLRAGGALALHLSGVPLPAAGGASAPTTGAATTAARWQARIDGTLDGTLGAAAQPLHAQFKLAATADAIDLSQARITAGDASALGKLKAARERVAGQPAWHLVGDGELNQVDPLPWWPGARDSAWARGPHRVNGRWQLDLHVRETIGEQLRRQGSAALAALRGQLQVDLADSMLAGLPMNARADVQGDGQALAVRAAWSAAGNQATLDGRFAVGAAQDRWQLRGSLPALAALQPLSTLLPTDYAASWPRAGALTLQAQLDGRWPQLQGGSGSLQAIGVNAGELALEDVQARWQFGADDDAAIELTLAVKGVQQGVQQGVQRIDELQAKVDGTLRAHRIAAHAETPARPPAWIEGLVGSSGSGTRAMLDARGAWRSAAAGGGRWLASDASLRVVARQAQGAPWLETQGLQAELQFDGGGALTQLQLSPGRAQLAGTAALRWSEASWRADGRRLDLHGELEPLAVAPLLARLQPELGWGGELTLAGRIDVRAAERVEAQVVLARSAGDLRIADEAGNPQSLGIEELQLAFSARDGVWRFAQGLAGRQIGEMAGAQTVRTSAQARWPPADAPLEGVLQARVAHLGAWGMWVPPGWRLGGNLRMTASLGGRFGAPQLRGEMHGQELAVRNVLQGVSLSDGVLDVSFEGELVRVQRLSFKGGDGSLSLSGEARLGATPSAKLQLAADRFRLLGRIDRRVITSGNAQLQLDREQLQLDGRFNVDEALIDFSKTNAPTLDNDVRVVRAAPVPGSSARDARAEQATPAPLRNAQVKLEVTLGDKLHIRGRGLDALLRGDLRLSTPGGRPALNGSVRTASGTYVAYAQRLVIERGELIFSGDPENPRLDILAIRPNLDVRVGVAVTGLLSNLRVRLYSDPEMAEMDKLSWLMLGRPSEGLGRNDSALVQRAALALLAGEDQPPTDQLLNQLGITDFSVRQGDTESRETIVSLGRQLSQRWYVGYERSVNATTGNWQLIYRIAQRFTVRAQSGEDNSLDFIWQWRW
jgi:translocation and assembly module TamB